MDGSKDSVSTELVTFKKYSKLVPELRKPILDYTKLSTLKEYSQCSKLCDEEIQVYNTKAPKKLEIKEDDSGITVSVFYSRLLFGHNRSKHKFFPHGSTMVQDVQAYVLKNYRYAKKSESDEPIWIREVFVEVNLKHCPVDIINIKHLLAIVDYFSVYLNKFMLDDFMKFAATTDFVAKKLVLKDCKNLEERVVLPSAFFKSKLTENLWLCTKFSKIDREDFLNLSLESFVINNKFIGMELIQEKILKLIELNQTKKFHMQLQLDADTARTLRLEQWFPLSIFPQRQYLDNTQITIGPTIRLRFCPSFPTLFINYIPPK